MLYSCHRFRVEALNISDSAWISAKILLPLQPDLSIVYTTQRYFSIMARVCDVTGKRPISGNNVSHANNRTKRRFLPNLQTKKFYVPEEDAWVVLRVSAAAIRTISKKGISEVIKDMRRDGVIFE